GRRRRRRLASRAMTAAETTARTPALPTPRLPLTGPVPAAPPVPVDLVLEGGAVAGGVLGRQGSRRRLLRLPLAGALALAFLVTCAVEGLPTDRVVLLGWVLAALAVHAATDGLRRMGLLLADWLPLAGLLLAYDASRGLADGFGATVH